MGASVRRLEGEGGSARAMESAVVSRVDCAQSMRLERVLEYTRLRMGADTVYLINAFGQELARSGDAPPGTAAGLCSLAAATGAAAAKLLDVTGDGTGGRTLIFGRRSYALLEPLAGNTWLALIVQRTRVQELARVGPWFARVCRVLEDVLTVNIGQGEKP
ncbi:MAG TPA: hypothetical protein P5300_06455 [Acidobacteriota bacterium]|nr:hypothetical protein [Acidobacteriota bacterium]